MIADEAEARAYVAQWADAEAMARIELLLARLAEENRHQNLVASATLECAWQRHVADSAQLLHHVPRETPLAPWFDLGTGAGFPGLVIACLRPGWQVFLVESRRRRVEWLRSIADELGLRRCRVEGTRLEALESVPAGVISARAFAPLPRLLALSARFSTADTMFLLPKGRSGAQELADAPKWIRRTFHVEQSRTDAGASILVGRLSKEARERLS